MHPQREGCRLARQHMVHLEGALTLGSRGSLLAWREPGGRASARRWQALEVGVDPRPPRARLTLGTADGAGTLHFLMLVPPRSGKLCLETDDGKVALAVELMTAPPLAVGELARGLAMTERRRLLGWLLGVCPALFGLATEPEFGFAVRDLLQAILPETLPGSALRRCHLPGRWTLAQTLVGNGFQSGRLEGFVIGGTGGLRRAVVAPVAPDPSAAGRNPLLAAFEDHVPTEAATFVLVGAGGLTYRRIEPVGSRLPSAAEWIAAVAAAGRPSVRDGALDALAILAERKAATPSYAALVREVRQLAPPPPPCFPGRVRATLALVADLDRQILAIGTLSDPDELVACLRLRRLGTPDVELRRADLLLGPHFDTCLDRPFAAAAPWRGTSSPHAPWRCHIVLRSGTELPVGEAPAMVAHADPLEHFLEAAAPLAAVPDAWPMLEPGARAAASAGLAKRRAVRSLVFGPALLRPRASLLLPFRRAAEVVRLAAMLAAEPDGRAVELVLVALEPDPGLEIEAASLAASHGRTIRLIVPTMPLQAADVPIIGIEFERSTRHHLGRAGDRPPCPRLAGSAADRADTNGRPRVGPGPRGPAAGGAVPSRPATLARGNGRHLQRCPGGNRRPRKRLARPGASGCGPSLAPSRRRLPGTNAGGTPLRRHLPRGRVPDSGSRAACCCTRSAPARPWRGRVPSPPRRGTVGDAERRAAGRGQMSGRRVSGPEASLARRDVSASERSLTVAVGSASGLLLADDLLVLFGWTPQAPPVEAAAWIGQEADAETPGGIAWCLHQSTGAGRRDHYPFVAVVRVHDAARALVHGLWLQPDEQPDSSTFRLEPLHRLGVDPAATGGAHAQVRTGKRGGARISGGGALAERSHGRRSPRACPRLSERTFCSPPGARTVLSRSWAAPNAAV